MKLEDKLVCSANFTDIDLAEKGYVIINKERHIWTKTSPTGKEILEWLKREHTYQELLVFIRENYGVKGEEVEKMIKSCIEDFYNQGILSINGKFVDKKPSYHEIEKDGLQQLWINITNRCNLNCPQCFAETKGHYVTDLAYNDIINTLDECDCNLQEIILSGGEPSLHPQLLDIVKFIKERQIKVKLLTNGSIVFWEEQKILDLLKLIDDIQVSIDGISMQTHDAIRGKGSFSNVIKCLKLIKNKKVRKGIAFTPMPENYKEMEFLYDFALGYELDYIHINRPSQPSNNSIYSNTDYFLSNVFFREIIESINLLRRRESKRRELFRSMDVKLPVINASFIPYKNLIDNIKKSRCAAGISTLSIMEDGSVFPCVSLSINRKTENKFGNIKEENILKIYQRTREKMIERFDVDSNSKCKDCCYKYFCGGGCRAAVDNKSCDLLCESFIDGYKEFLEHLSLTNIRMLYNKRKESYEKN